MVIEGSLENEKSPKPTKVKVNEMSRWILNLVYKRMKSFGKKSSFLLPINWEGKEGEKNKKVEKNIYNIFFCFFNRSKNLNTNVDKKGKSTITANDNDIKEIVEEEEDEDENDLQENAILEEEDDLSDIDFGDDEWKHKIRMENLNIRNSILSLIVFWFWGLNILLHFDIW